MNGYGNGYISVVGGNQGYGDWYESHVTEFSQDYSSSEVAAIVRPNYELLGYLGKCKAFIPCDLTITVKSATQPKSLPCSAGTDNTSVNIGSVKVGDTLKATEIIKNSANIYWYKTTVSGKTAYVFAGDFSYKVNTPTISVEGATYPSATHEKGKTFGIAGTIKASTNISSVTAYIKGSDITKTVSGIGATSYSLSGAIDNALTFDTLPAGDYRYIVEVETEQVYSGDGKSLGGMCMIPVKVIDKAFTVTSNEGQQQEDNPSTVNTDDYRAWAQTDSRWGGLPLGTGGCYVADSGCTVTAVTKLIIQSGLRSASDFNVGTLVRWLNSNGGFSGSNLYWGVPSNMVSGFENQGDILGWGTYSASGYNSQIISWIRAGYHMLIAVNGGDHWVAVDEAKSLQTGTVYIFDSLSGTKNVDITLAGRYSTIASVHAYKGGNTGAQTYTVTYNANGGLGAPSAQTKTEGTALTLSSTVPTRAGYTFKGWAKSSDGSVVYEAGGRYTTDSNVTLYAVWEQNSYSVKLCNYDGTEFYTAADRWGSYTIPAAYPKVSGLYFSGWAYSSSADVFDVRPGDTIVVSDDITLYPLYITYEELVSGESVLVYDISEFKDTGFAFEEVDYQLKEEVKTSAWSDWSAWSQTAVSSNETTQVETCTGYGWYYYRCPNCGNHSHGWGSGACYTWAGGCGADIPDNFTQMYDKTNWNTASDWYGTGKKSATINGQRWFVWSDGGTKTLYRSRVYNTTTVEQAKTVKAYKATAVPKYSVTFDANGGIGAPAEQEKLYNTALVLNMTPPTKQGSVFLGWAESKEAEAPEYTLGGSYTKNEDAKLYAVWAENACDVETSWSDWSTEEPAGYAESMVESKTQYRSRTKETAKSTESTKEGWVPDGTHPEYGEWGNWSAWNESSISASNTKQVESAKVYRYYYFLCDSCKDRNPYGGNCGCGGKSNDFRWVWSTIAYSASKPTQLSYNIGGDQKSYTTSLGDGQTWYFTTAYTNSTAIGTYDNSASTEVIKTGYRSRTRTETTYYDFYRWSDWSNWGDTEIAEEDGKEVETRTVYRHIVQTVVPHTEDTGTTIKDATCTVEGVKVFKCSECGEEIRTEAIPVKPHTDDGGKVTKAASCSEQGVLTHSCTVCKTIISTEPIKMTEHTAVTANKKDVSCTTDGYTGDQVCSKCNKVISYGTAIIASGHTPENDAAAEPDCTHTGLTAGSHCAVCKEVLVKQEEIQASGHEWGAWEVTKAATINAVGEETRKCSKCTATETREIPALPDEDAPQICVRSSIGRPGSDVYVTVSLKNNPGIISMRLHVAYDKSVFTLTEVTDGEKLGLSNNPEDLTVYPYILSWTNDMAKTDFTYNGDIVVLKFKVAADAEPGEYDFTVSYDNAEQEIFNAAIKCVDFAVVNTDITVAEYLIGDVNNDGKVTSIDRITLARYLDHWTGYESLNCYEAADVNGDGKVTSVDRIILARYLDHWGAEYDKYFTVNSAN